MSQYVTSGSRVPAAPQCARPRRSQKEGQGRVQHPLWHMPMPRGYRRGQLWLIHREPKVLIPAPFSRYSNNKCKLSSPLTPVSTATMPLTTPSVYPPPSREFMKWPSRRSVVHSTKGIVACTQPLAAKCGIDILNAGGNAAVSHLWTVCTSHTYTNKPQDAAVAVGMFIYNLRSPSATNTRSCRHERDGAWLDRHRR